jgi:hypothetical protein
MTRQWEITLTKKTSSPTSPMQVTFLVIAESESLAYEHIGKTGFNLKRFSGKMDKKIRGFVHPNGEVLPSEPESPPKAPKGFRLMDGVFANGHRYYAIPKNTEYTQEDMRKGKLRPVESMYWGIHGWKKSLE